MRLVNANSPAASLRAWEISEPRERPLWLQTAPSSGLPGVDRAFQEATVPAGEADENEKNPNPL